jgi:hypothetical protein
MKTKLTSALAGVALAFASAAPALAHHSFAMFDRSREVRLDGVIKEFRWINPHSWIAISVQGAGGASTDWSIEMTSPNNLVMAGWKRTSLNPGDKVVMFVYPLKDGGPGGSFVRVQLPDGRTLSSTGSTATSSAPPAAAH